MGDYWNNSGFYEQRERQAAEDRARRDQDMVDMWRSQDEARERNQQQEYNRNMQNRNSGSSGYSGGSSSSIGYSIGYALGRLFAQPLIQIGTLPPLLSRGIFLMLPLAIAALYIFRSVPPWLLAVLVSLLLAFSSPLLVKILRTVMRIAIIIAVLLVVIGIAGFVFHWWHFAPVAPVPPPSH